MTPLVKAWCSDQGFEIASEALQVHGGMGYIEETGAAQHLRDARINMIYEGTNGIQALDLVGRKLALADGRLPWDWFEEFAGDLAALEAAGHKDLAVPLGAALEVVKQATAWLQREHADPDDAAAGATPYLRMFATTAGGFLLARAALAAERASDRLAEERLACARFYAVQLLPAGGRPAAGGHRRLRAAAPRPEGAAQLNSSSVETKLSSTCTPAKLASLPT